MNINRHNYETFFLLYVDKELSASVRKTVEMFLKENPDLQIELDFLQQTIVMADDVVLEKKDWLYMEEDISALQENLMLYADDELDTAAKQTVENIIASDKATQAEWTVLQKTKLIPDFEVVYPDKTSLYRKEPGRVVVFKWWRVAAAAVLLGIALWTGIAVYQNNNNLNNGNEKLVNTKKTNPVELNKDSGSGIVPVTGLPADEQETENISVETTPKANQDQTPGITKTTIGKNMETVLISPKENTTVQNTNNNKPDNNLPNPALQNINNGNSNETTVQNVLPSNNSTTRVSGNNETAVVKITPKENKAVNENTGNNKTEPPVSALQVVNVTNPVDGENDTRYLNIDNDKQKRTGLGGILRKAKRVLERNTALKTGEGIKIAGFEIAL